jgi:phospholipid/cholesterol/gamma-HCH transport system permease protein
LIIIGRSGSVLVEEIGQMTRSGHLRALASHGVDPIDIIMIPRAFAMAAAAFLLTLLFLHTALWSGYLAATIVGVTDKPPDEFTATVLGIMSLNDYLLLVAKPTINGYIVGYLSIWFATRIEHGPHGIRRALPKAFAASLIATIAIGILITALL